jgi:hypothetical protein
MSFDSTLFDANNNACNIVARASCYCYLGVGRATDSKQDCIYQLIPQLPSIRPRNDSEKSQRDLVDAYESGVVHNILSKYFSSV